MIADRMKPVLAAAAFVAALSSAADAGDDRQHRDRDHRPHRVENNRWDRQGDGRWNRPAEIDHMTGNLPGRSIRRVRQLAGFYGGAIEAWPARGNGIYFLRDGDYRPLRNKPSILLAPKAKVIDIEAEMGGNAFASQACVFEAGVCVIRGN